MQLNKNIKIFFNYFLGPLLFAWLVFSIYRQIRHQPQLETSWLQVKASFNSYKISYLIAALFLILVNWGVEAWKWKISVATFYPIKFIQAFKAVLSGVTFSVSMPNRVGEYLGRVLYLPEGSRLKTISVTLVGSFAQVLVTLGVGMAGLLVLRGPLLNAYPQIVIWYQFILYGLLTVILILVLLYFNVAGAVFLFQRWVKSNKYLYLIESLRNFSVQLLLKILLLSLLRYGVFVVQYILIFYLFGVNVSVATVVSVMSVVFLAMAIIPSIALVEVGMRGEISLKLMGVFSANSLGIGLTSVTVWFINLIIPAIVGSLLILNIKILKNEMEKRKYLLTVLLLAAGFAINAGKPFEDGCDDLKNTSTQDGEQISFNVYYSLAGIYVNAGTASFTNKVESLNNKPVYHIVAEGGSRPSYDWIYKVRDKYESYIDTATMKTVKFIRNVEEGSTKFYENIAFNRAANTAVTDKGVFKITSCTQDVLSSTYYARNIDFSKYRPNDKISFSMFIDNQLYSVYIRYMGKDVISTKYGKFKSIKFKTLLIAGTLFKGGEDMTVWISDDANRVPVRIESSILVGSIKVDMMSYKNLRYPLTGLIKRKN